METYLILLAALAPVAVLFFYIFRKDKHQQEPVGELLKAFGLGILSTFVSLAISAPLGLIGLYSDAPETFIGSVATSFFGAAIPEEIAKFVMFWLLVRKNRFFDEKMDGIVYASCVALGFAALENVLYLFSNYDAWLSVGIVRALFSVPGHFFFGVIMGYYYSLVRFDPLTPKVNRILVLAAPILAHGIFNSLLFMADVMNPHIGAVLSIIFVAVCIKLRKYAGSKIREHLRNDGVIQ